MFRLLALFSITFSIAIGGLFVSTSQCYSQPATKQKPQRRIEKRNKNQRRFRALENVTVHPDLKYATVDGHDLLLDLYIPKNVDQPPLLVWIHGGGWRKGSKQGNGFRWAIEKGYSVASIDYRLTDVAIFPAQIHDCKAAVRWLRAHADKYKINTKKIGIGGSSAGGHLVALFGASNGDPRLEGKVGDHLDQSSSIHAVCDLYGPTDLTQMDKYAIPNAPFKHNAPNSPEAFLLGGPIMEKLDVAAQANPITYVDPKDPAFLILHGTKDPLVPWQQSHIFNAALIKNRVPVTFHLLNGARHGGKEFASPEARKTMESFLDLHIKGNSPKPEYDGDKNWMAFDTALFNDWEIKGGYATYHFEGNEIVGRTMEGSKNTFLSSKKEYSDFELNFEVKCDPELNSGVQIRSHTYEKDTPQPSRPKRIREKGEVFGYQVEIASNGNAGRIWDEGRHTRWHDETEPSEKTKAAYKPGEWNSYRIVAKGNRIQTFINDTPVADITDDEDASGFIGFQVHSIKKGKGPYQVRWRSIKIRELN